MKLKWMGMCGEAYVNSLVEVLLLRSANLLRAWGQHVVGGRHICRITAAEGRI